MNAGASGEEIKDLIIKVSYLDLEDMEIKTIDQESINFQYRNSFFQKKKDKIILETELQLQSGNQKEIKDKMDLIKAQRWAKQPRDYPNAGSVFKRPKGYFVGKLTQDLDLKGYTVGGARLSEKHGGFIINFNECTGQDILNIIKHVQQKVFDMHEVNLEIEQRII
jgi:UDP-N-acetylmuramate dehydrogenase